LFLTTSKKKHSDSVAAQDEKPPSLVEWVYLFIQFDSQR
jgi:hypothetical protein